MPTRRKIKKWLRKQIFNLPLQLARTFFNIQLDKGPHNVAFIFGKPGLLGPNFSWCNVGHLINPETFT